ncbi:uncharacterized protein LOC143861877 [Tasmannia lanceolata]|uniref:uncharacterized protein LOC143861877 n=1 Tax=Tasmannia lanceolata TaxID=3420 RepID=UPI00406478FD
MATVVSVPRVCAGDLSTKKINKKEGILFDFPLRVYCVSSMSKQQRLEMANQLKLELTQVRSLLDELNNKNPPQKPKKRKSEPINSETTATKKQKTKSNEKKDLNPKELPSLSIKPCENHSHVFKKTESLPPLPLKPKLVNSKRIVAEKLSYYNVGASNIGSFRTKMVNSKRKISEKAANHNGRSESNVGLSNIHSFKAKVVNKEDCPVVTYEDCPLGFEHIRPMLMTAKRVEGKCMNSNGSSQDSNLPSRGSDIGCPLDEESTRAKSVSATILAKMQKTIPMTAAVVMKRERKLEREAARLALQKMEETISIYDDCQFLKDLEMVGIIQSVPICSSLANEMSCFISHNNLKFFEPNRRKPLERLGLYMKVEDDDDYQVFDHFGVDREEGEMY